MATNFKLGRHEPGIGLCEHRHRDVYSRREDERGPHVLIAPSVGHIPILIRLSRALAAPYVFAYDLLSPTEPYEEGRYELAEQLDGTGLAHLLNGYRDFFEFDARHHLRIASVSPPSSSSPSLIYDQHNYIYAYGPLERFEAVLAALGIGVGEAELPIPHSHHIRSEYDAELRRLFSTRSWNFAPPGEEY